MNNLTLPISDVAYSVERPIIYDIVRQVMDVTEISSKTPIKYMGEDAKSLQPNSTIDSGITFTNNWPFSERMEVEVSEEYDADRILSTSVLNPDNYPLFRDNNLDVLMRPVYGVTNVTITFKYRAPDRNSAIMWRNNIKTRTSMGRDIILHDIKYSYHIPDTYIVILKEIHRLRESIAGYGDTFEKYLQDHITERSGVVSNLNGEEFKYVISECQTRIQGWFEFAGVPEKPEKVDDGSAYITTFTYKFTYDKPINFNMLYPYVIHNQLLNKKYREIVESQTLKTKNQIYSLSSLSFSRFEDGYEILSAYGNRGLDIPSFDYSFLPNNILPGSARIATVLCTITPDNKKALFNLNQLGNFNLNKEVIKYLKLDKDNITKNYRSIYNLSLYENNTLKADDILFVDDDLNVSSVRDLDLRKTYRVRISIIVNIDMIPLTILNNIKKYNRNNITHGINLANAINAILKDQGACEDINKAFLTDLDLVKLGIIISPINPESNLPVNTNLPIFSDIYDQNKPNTNLSQCMFIVADKNTGV